MPSFPRVIIVCWLLLMGVPGLGEGDGGVEDGKGEEFVVVI